ncbi:MAG: response regulator [bacterium]
MAKILIVDDEKDLANVLGTILELEGYQVTTVLDGYKAIEHIKTTSYDLVLMDIRLPGINGVETFIKIKEIDPEVKVIMMTAFSVEDLIEKAIKQGAYACIHKPFEPEKVIALIEEAITQNQKVILIANGDGKTREELKEVLTSKGYGICTAKNTEEAITILKDECCHCILLNLNLPGVNGLNILKEAKKLCEGVVVIVMTDYELPEMIKEAKRPSAYACIKKPIDFDELVKLLKEANL